MKYFYKDEYDSYLLYPKYKYDKFSNRINTFNLSYSDLEELIFELFQIIKPCTYIELFKDLGGTYISFNTYWLILHDNGSNCADIRALNILLKYNIDIEPATLTIFKMVNELSDENKLKIELE